MRPLALPGLVLLVVLTVACGGPAESDTASADPASDATQTTTTTPTTTRPPTTTTEAPTTTIATTTTTTSTTTTLAQAAAPEQPEMIRENFSFAGGLRADLYAPSEPGPWPVAITLHGGGWFAGDRTSTASLAEGLARRGVVVFNIEYRTVLRGGSFPATVDEIACALALAHDVADEYSTEASGVTVIGHSAGAHLGALVSMAPGEFGLDCAEGQPSPAAGFVGLAGPYNVELLDFLLTPFFGARLDEDPELWTRGNPLGYAGSNPELRALLIHGSADQVVPLGFSEELTIALDDAGHQVDLEIVRGADHMAVIDPKVVGDVIVEWLRS